MRKEDPGRRFSREFKIAAVQRMAAGANVSKLSRELGIRARGSTSGRSSFALAGRPRCVVGGRRKRKRCISLVMLTTRAVRRWYRTLLTSFRGHWLGSANWSALSGSRRPISIFFKRPCSTSESAPAERRAWRDDIYAVIETMTAPGLQGMIGVERMCRLAGVSRSGYYRQWQASTPRREETGLRDEIQRLALANAHYGYRRIAVMLGREGWHVNHKRVLRLRTTSFACARPLSCR